MVRLHSVGVWRTLQRPCFAARAVIHEQGRLCFSPVTVRNAWSSSRPRRIILDKPARRRASTGDSGAEAAALEHRYRWLGIPVGSVAGLFGSLVGVGGGVIMVPMMTCRPLQLQVRGPRSAEPCTGRAPAHVGNPANLTVWCAGPLCVRDVSRRCARHRCCRCSGVRLGGPGGPCWRGDHCRVRDADGASRCPAAPQSQGPGSGCHVRRW